MRYSVISIANHAKGKHIIEQALDRMSNDFCLIFQTANPVEASSLVKSFSVQIVLMQEGLSFYNADMFIAGARASNPHLQMILLRVGSNGTDAAAQPDFPVSSILHIDNLTVESLAAALQRAAENYRISEDSAASGADQLWSEYYLNWINQSNRLSGMLINLYSGTGITAEDLRLPETQPFALIIAGIADEGDWSFYNQKSELLGILYHQLMELLAPWHGTALIASDRKLCFIVSLTDVLPEETPVRVCAEIETLRKKLLLPEMIFSASDPETDFNHLPTLYRSVDSTLRYHFFTDSARVITPAWLKQNSVPLSVSEFQILTDDVRNAFQANDEFLLNSALEKIRHFTKQLLSFSGFDYVWGQLNFLYYFIAQNAEIEPSQEVARLTRLKYSSFDRKFSEMRDLYCSLLHAIRESPAQEMNLHVQKAAQYMKDHLTESLSLSEVAEAIHVTPTYLSHLFQQDFNMTFVRYKNELRVRRAAELLSEGISLADASHQTGFSDMKYFSRQFKQIIGVSPRIWQKQHLAKGTNPDESSIVISGER